MAATAFSIVFWAVMMTTRRSANGPLTWSSNRRPSIPGIRMSTKAMAYDCCSKRARASSALAARSTVHSFFSSPRLRTQRRLSSSSTTRIRSPLCSIRLHPFGSGGEVNPHCGSLPGKTLDLEFAPMHPRDLIGQSQPQSGSTRLGSEVRGKNLVHQLRGDSDSGVGDFDQDQALGLPGLLPTGQGQVCCC